MKIGNWYKIKEANGTVHTAQYVGRQKGFECCVCGFGKCAYTFNIWYDKDGGYETWGFGKEHFPEIIEDLGIHDEALLDN